MILEPTTVPILARTSGRKADPNPFIDGEYGDVIRAMPVDPKPGEGGAYNLQVPGINDMKHNKEFAKTAKQLRDAAAKRGVTMRQVHTQVVGADGKPSVNIQFWAIKLIVRMTKAEKTAKDAEVAKAAIEQAEADALEPNTEDDGPVVVAEDAYPEPAPVVTPKTPTRSRRVGK